jgi:hypothetical protein
MMKSFQKHPLGKRTGTFQPWLWCPRGAPSRVNRSKVKMQETAASIEQLGGTVPDFGAERSMERFLDFCDLKSIFAVPDFGTSLSNGCLKSDLMELSVVEVV